MAVLGDLVKREPKSVLSLREQSYLNSSLFSALLRQEVDHRQVAKLLAKGACIEAVNEWQMTPLQFATLMRRKNGIEAAVEFGAELDNYGVIKLTALQMAKRDNYWEGMALLERFERKQARG